MRWIFGVKEKLGGVPTREQLTAFLWDTLNKGQVIPGYGHGVLRVTDPRYLAQQRFAEEHLPDDENFRIVRMIFDVAPKVLMEHGKAKDPGPTWTRRPAASSSTTAWWSTTTTPCSSASPGRWGSSPPWCGTARSGLPIERPRASPRSG
jgi:hypothetical protein